MSDREAKYLGPRRRSRATARNTRATSSVIGQVSKRGML